MIPIDIVLDRIPEQHPRYQIHTLTIPIQLNRHTKVH